MPCLPTVWLPAVPAHGEGAHYARFKLWCLPCLPQMSTAPCMQPVLLPLIALRDT